MAQRSAIRAYQERALPSIESYLLFGDATLSPRVRDAYLAVPRHLFIARYRDFVSGQWHEVTDGTLEEHLPALYRDDGLAIGVDGAGAMVTISRPGWVLYMLELLGIEEGHRVFEVGTGSGWNAALCGWLAGKSGRVESYEIVPSLAESATRSIADAGLRNVRVVAGDAGVRADGDGGERFDRLVFTAGSYDVPGWMHDRAADGARLLLALKLPGGGDVLVLLERTAHGFVSSAARGCEVVWMRGATHDPALDPVRIEATDEWQRLASSGPVASRPYVLGGRGQALLAQRTSGLRSFLALVEPRMRWYADPRGWPFYSFGLYDADGDSLVVADGESLTSYGSSSPVAADALVARVHEWVDRGMPSADTMPLRVYRRGEAPAIGDDEVLVRRNESDFVWTLPPRS